MIILNIGFLFGDLGALASNQGIVIPSWEAGAVIGSIVQPIFEEQFGYETQV